ncbi:hypothetical protein MPK70_gp244 [Erwinia phage pEa_SNUABM_33]|uniref:Uncharacterized protein n=1 Tax=Erwinia phage pEa_SNUABM_33 TaxID=2869556 RepID=A0AAE8C074_9CAUD|nr:hypothetical protein MPK70_gp244 [Erwinia phage pEa_SNUABM_33]QZE58120.1 hypothetical protein pEaSNUABM33_00244 [Erwinia phage pEa_SNUABM_33]
MRTQIYTADILNLETVTVNEEDGSEVRTPTIVPNVEGEPEFNVDTVYSLLQSALPEESAPDTRRIVLVTLDLVAGFSTNGLENFFDPIARVEDITAGNVGSILGLQVVVNDKSVAPCLAVANVSDVEEGVTILSYSAARVKL